eukprot:g10807.t1
MIGSKKTTAATQPEKSGADPDRGLLPNQYVQPGTFHQLGMPGQHPQHFQPSMHPHLYQQPQVPGTLPGTMLGGHPQLAHPHLQPQHPGIGIHPNPAMLGQQQHLPGMPLMNHQHPGYNNPQYGLAHPYHAGGLTSGGQLQQHFAAGAPGGIPQSHGHFLQPGAAAQHQIPDTRLRQDPQLVPQHQQTTALQPHHQMPEAAGAKGRPSIHTLAPIWENQLRFGSNSILCINMSGMQMTDEKMRMWAQWMDEIVKGLVDARGQLRNAKVDFSKNPLLTDIGFRRVTTLMKKHRVHVREFVISENVLLSDLSVRYLIEYVKASENPVHKVSLLGNNISPDSIVALGLAMQAHAAYPRFNASSKCYEALELRVSKNLKIDGTRLDFAASARSSLAEAAGPGGATEKKGLGSITPGRTPSNLPVALPPHEQEQTIAKLFHELRQKGITFVCDAKQATHKTTENVPNFFFADLKMVDANALGGPQKSDGMNRTNLSRSSSGAGNASRMPDVPPRTQQMPQPPEVEPSSILNDVKAVQDIIAEIGSLNFVAPEQFDEGSLGSVPAGLGGDLFSGGCTGGPGGAGGFGDGSMKGGHKEQYINGGKSAKGKKGKFGGLAVGDAIGPPPGSFKGKGKSGSKFGGGAGGQVSTASGVDRATLEAMQYHSYYLQQLEMQAASQIREQVRLNGGGAASSERGASEGRPGGNLSKTLAVDEENLKYLPMIRSVVTPGQERKKAEGGLAAALAGAGKNTSASTSGDGKDSMADKENQDPAATGVGSNGFSVATARTTSGSSTTSAPPPPSKAMTMLNRVLPQGGGPLFPNKGAARATSINARAKNAGSAATKNKPSLWKKREGTTLIPPVLIRNAHTRADDHRLVSTAGDGGGNTFGDSGASDGRDGGQNQNGLMSLLLLNKENTGGNSVRQRNHSSNKAGARNVLPPPPRTPSSAVLPPPGGGSGTGGTGNNATKKPSGNTFFFAERAGP